MSTRQFRRKLEKEVHRYIEILEGIFGKCDPNYIFGTIEASCHEYPQTYFPEKLDSKGREIVNIQITQFPWSNRCLDQGIWQVAHESVHLLDPVKGGTTVLEEGIATWFQYEPQFHRSLVKEYIRSSAPSTSQVFRKYKIAKHLVHRCMPQIIPAIKELRSQGVRIEDIKSDMLASELPNVAEKTIERLCSRF